MFLAESQAYVVGGQSPEERTFQQGRAEVLSATLADELSASLKADGFRTVLTSASLRKYQENVLDPRSFASTFTILSEDVPDHADQHDCHHDYPYGVNLRNVDASGDGANDGESIWPDFGN